MADAGDSALKIFEPNPALRMLNHWFFDKITVDDAWVEQVRELSGRGTVVYVLRSLNLIDYLALDYLTKRSDLPRIRYVNDLHLGGIGAGDRSWLRMFGAGKRTSESEQLAAALQNGGSAALFLKRPPNALDVAAGASGGRGLKEGDEHIRTLIRLQRESTTPILLVPQVFVWTNRPDTHGANPLDVVFGPREWPSHVRTLGQFLYNYRHVELRAGEPLDLAHYLQTETEGSDDVYVRRIIYAVLRRLERERKTATGPAQQRSDRQRLQVLRSPKLQKAITHMAGERTQDRTALNHQVIKMLREMQATPDSATIKGLEVLLDRVFHRIYKGIEVDAEGLQRLRDLSRDASIVLLPSHKSHVDYLVLSYIFNEHNLQLPMIAAGDNLSFFPLGTILRRAGGFFIRRSFHGDKLYSTVVEAYVRRLLRDGFTLELFLEGGRSRTGKLLEPKFGLLLMIAEAALSLPHRKVYFVPISIGYERVVETGAYGHEATGGDKQKEDAAGLLKTTEVLRHRYGRINVQFGDAVTLDDIRTELGFDLDQELVTAKRRAVVVRLANRTMDEINRVTAVTPGALTALALLSDRRRGVPHEDLLVRCQRLLRVLLGMNARVTPLTATAGVLRSESIREALHMFVRAELIEAYEIGDRMASIERQPARSGHGAVYCIPERKRLELDTSKNHIVHFFVTRGLIAMCVLYPPRPPVSEAVLRDRALGISKLFKHEFRFPADASFDEVFGDMLAQMIADNELVRVGDQITLGEGREGWTADQWLTTYASIIRNFFEGYRIAARGLSLLLKNPMVEKELVRRTLLLGDRMFLSGDISLREAVNKSLVTNALVAFREQGYLRLREGKYVLTDSFENAEAVSAIEGRIAGFLATS